MSQTYGGMISFVVTCEEYDEALIRDRNACENIRVINIAVSLGGSRFSVQASGVHDSRHDTPRAQEKRRFEGRSHTYNRGIGESQGSCGQSTQLTRSMRRLGLQCTGGYVNIDEKIEWLTAAAAERGIYIYTVMRGMMVRRRSRSRWTTTVLRCDIFHEFQECSSFESNLSITCYYSRKKPILLAIRTTYYGTLIDSKIQTYSYINRTQTNTVERCLYPQYF